MPRLSCRLELGPSPPLSVPVPLSCLFKLRPFSFQRCNHLAAFGCCSGHFKLILAGCSLAEWVPVLCEPVPSQALGFPIVLVSSHQALDQPLFIESTSRCHSLSPESASIFRMPNRITFVNLRIQLQLSGWRVACVFGGFRGGGMKWAFATKRISSDALQLICRIGLPFRRRTTVTAVAGVVAGLGREPEPEQ